jgi:hypothetical protein
MAPHKVEEISASKAISLLGMMNGELKGKIEQLVVVFPHVDLITIRDILVTCKGGVSEASNVLADSAGASSFELSGASSSKPTILSKEDDDSHMGGITTSGENDKVRFLKEACPFHATSEIRLMLSTCNGDVAAASLRLTESYPAPNGKASKLAENTGHEQEIPERPTTSDSPVEKSQSPPSTGSLTSRERYPGVSFRRLWLVREVKRKPQSCNLRLSKTSLSAGLTRSRPHPIARNILRGLQVESRVSREK